MYLKSNSKSGSLSRNIGSPPYFHFRFVGYVVHERVMLGSRDAPFSDLINRLRHKPTDEAALSNVAVDVTTVPQRVKPDMRRVARKLSFIYKYTLYQYSRRMKT